MTYNDLKKLGKKIEHIRDSSFSLEDVLKTKNLTGFDLLSPEDKAKAEDKLKAFDQIVKPNQNQENDIKKEDAWFDTVAEKEYQVFYGDLMRNVTAGEYREVVRRELNI